LKLKLKVVALVFHGAALPAKHRTASSSEFICHTLGKVWHLVQL